jgi:hypothetical protein
MRPRGRVNRRGLATFLGDLRVIPDVMNDHPVRGFGFGINQLYKRLPHGWTPTVTQRWPLSSRSNPSYVSRDRFSNLILA